MRRELIAALAAEAVTVPWAMRREVFDAARAAMLTGGAAIPEARLGVYQRLLGTNLQEPVGTGLTPDAEATADPKAALDKAAERGVARKPGGVAVIPVRGVISNTVSFFDLLFGGGATPPGWVLARVRQAVEDDAIKAVVLDFDSPGGKVIGVQEAAQGIAALKGRKPIVAQVSGQLCSAAYWMAAPCDEIVATETALVGSLGVYMEHEDYSKLYEDIGVKRTYIQEGKYKTEGNDSEPLSDEARAHLQEMCGDYMEMFMNTVAKGRGVSAAVARGEKFGQGRTYTAARAVQRGLADKVRDLAGTLAAYGVNPQTPASDSRGRALAMLQMDVDSLGL